MTLKRTLDRLINRQREDLESQLDRRDRNQDLRRKGRRVQEAIRCEDNDIRVPA